jgi:MoxR-like ATPase
MWRVGKVFSDAFLDLRDISEQNVFVFNSAWRGIGCADTGWRYYGRKCGGFLLFGILAGENDMAKNITYEQSAGFYQAVKYDRAKAERVKNLQPKFAEAMRVVFQGREKTAREDAVPAGSKSTCPKKDASSARAKISKAAADDFFEKFLAFAKTLEEDATEEAMSGDPLDEFVTACVMDCFGDDNPERDGNLATLERMAGFIEENIGNAFAREAGLREENRQYKQMLRAAERQRRRGFKLERRHVAAIHRLKEKIKINDRALGEFYRNNPDAFYALHLRDMLEQSRDLHENGGRLVETAYVRKKLERILNRLERGKPILLYGETGAGKTEIARLAGERFSGRSPEVVRGYPAMGSEELFGHLALTTNQVIENFGELDAKIQAEADAYRRKNPKADAEKLREFQDLVTARLVRENKTTVSEFILGAVYKAARDGKVVILDEANYIPAGILAKLNEIMIKQPGDQITVQEDGVAPIPVAGGFGIILTGNIGDRYQNGRATFDTALQNRLQGGKIEYDFLPQTTEGRFEETADPGQKQLFEVVIESIIDDDGGVYLPEEGLDQLWNLAKLTKLTQLVFAGKIADTETGKNYAFHGGDNEMAIRTGTLISNRNIQDIVAEWQLGFLSASSGSLDDIIYEHLIEDAGNSVEAAYFYQLAHDACGFFQSAPYIQAPEYDLTKTGGSFTAKKETVETGKIEPAKDLRYFTPPELAEALYGQPPERTVWPNEELNGAANQETMMDLVLDTEEWLKGQQEELDEYSELLGGEKPLKVVKKNA